MTSCFNINVLFSCTDLNQLFVSEMSGIGILDRQEQILRLSVDPVRHEAVKAQKAVESCNFSLCVLTSRKR
jgi:hypothetical protein